MNRDRRSVITALGLALPLGLANRAAAAVGPPPGLGFRSFEAGVRDLRPGEVRRVEVGHCDALHAGLAGCCNDHPFAGVPAGRLRIVRTGCEPGPAVNGVRLYAAFVDVTLSDEPGRPFDFAALPPAAVFVGELADGRKTV